MGILIGWKVNFSIRNGIVIHLWTGGKADMENSREKDVVLQRPFVIAIMVNVTVACS